MRESAFRLVLLLLSAGTLCTTPIVGSSGSDAGPGLLSGWFQSISYDDPVHSRSGTRYFLTDDVGDGAEIFLSPELRDSMPHAPTLGPRRAEVRGEWVEMGGRTGLKASSVHFLDSVSDGSPTRIAANLLQAKSGPQPWLVILCKFPDVAAEPRSTAYYQELLGPQFPGMDHFWREVSYGAINLEGSRVTGWYTLPHPRSYYVYGNPLWLDQLRATRDCTAAADRDVYFPDYAGLTLVFNDFVGEKYLGYGGPLTLTLDGRTRTWGVTWLPPTLLHNVYGHDRDANHYVFAHEMGHALGLPHSSGAYGDTYDNFWDLMSYWGTGITNPTFGLQAIHTNSYHKDLLGWIAPEQKYVASPGTQETIHLTRLAQPDAASFRMAEIPMPGSPGRYYTAEARMRAGYDAGLYGDAVILYDVDPGRYSSSQWGSALDWRPSEVIDTDGNGFTGDDGAMQVPGETFGDRANGISISVESASESGFTITVNNNARFLPHLANGSGTRSTLMLANPSPSVKTSGTVKFFRSDGESLDLVLNGQARDASLPFQLPPRGVGYFVTDGLGELQTGAAMIGSTSPVEASAVLSGRTGAAGVFAAPSATSLIVPLDSDPARGVRGGAALMNPNSREIQVTCHLRSPDGKIVSMGEITVSVAARGQVSFFADEILPSLRSGAFRGTLIASSSLPFNGMALVGTGPGQLTTLAAGPIDRASRAKLVGVVSTFAGQVTVKGSDDGDRHAARFSSPNDIATDQAGNLYIADTGNHTIRKITPQGVVSTLAGLAGVSGSEDGTGASAHFYSPRALCADAGGTLFVADYGNHVIRKVSPDGTVTTMAGSPGEAGAADGPAGLARFNGPRGIVADKIGNVYVSDTSNHAIRKITPDGNVVTFAGLSSVPGYADGAGVEARFDGPQRIVMDSSQNLLVADYNNCVIRKVTPEGMVTTVSGTPGLHGAMDGPPGKALFGYPLGMTMDSSDSLYLTDGWIVRQVTRDGSVTTLAGSPKINTTPGTSLSGSSDGTGSEARFASPGGLSVDPSGRLLVADRENHAIRALDLATVTDRKYFSQFVSGDGLASTILLVNPSLTESCKGAIELRDSDGGPLRVELNGAPVEGHYGFTLNPAGSLSLTAGSTGGVGGGLGGNYVGHPSSERAAVFRCPGVRGSRSHNACVAPAPAPRDRRRSGDSDRDRSLQPVDGPRQPHPDPEGHARRSARRRCRRHHPRRPRAACALSCRAVPGEAGEPVRLSGNPGRRCHGADCRHGPASRPRGVGCRPRDSLTGVGRPFSPEPPPMRDPP